MADVDVAYNEDQAPLEALLRSIDRPGNYCTQGRLFVPMPQIEVEGAGSLSFPITTQQAHALAATAAPAPYGRGDQTLVDPSVRACRQIDAAQVRVAGSAWRGTLKQIVDRAATGLGCPPERTCAPRSRPRSPSPHSTRTASTRCVRSRPATESFWSTI